MRKAAVFAAILALAGQAHAADLGKPKDLTPEQIMALPDPSKATCYVETSIAGTFLRDTREAQAGVGGGCDARLYNLIIGGGARADLSDWQNSASIFAKIGLVLNDGVNLLGTAEWKVPEFKLDRAGQLMLGAEAEVKLAIWNPNLWGFFGGQVAATKFGSLATKDDVVVRTGLRLKF